MFNHSDSGSLTVAQQKSAAALLGQAFSQDPFMTYLLPNATTRVQQLTTLLLPAIRCSLRYGGVEVAPDGGGTLAWISGEYFPLRFPLIVQSGLIWTPLSIGLSAFKRLRTHETLCGHALKTRAPDGFAYLWVVGVHPNAAGRGLGKRLIQSALDTMQRRGHSACLLRTENPRNVEIYEHLGFKAIHTDISPGSNLRYWLLSQELG